VITENLGLLYDIGSLIVGGIVFAIILRVFYDFFIDL